MPVARARCITDPIGNKWRAFIFKHGCSKIVADASVIKRQLVQQNGIDPAKIEVVGSAADLQKFNSSRDRMKFRREMGFSAETPLIANIGMIRPDKGQLMFVETARLVLQERPDARFVVVGQGTGNLKLGKKVRTAINSAGLAGEVFMIGYRWDTPDIFAACDMVAIASLHTEVSPIVLREAFASGRPRCRNESGRHSGNHRAPAKRTARRARRQQSARRCHSRISFRPKTGRALCGERPALRTRAFFFRPHDAGETSPRCFTESNAASGAVPLARRGNFEARSGQNRGACFTRLIFARLTKN